MPTNLFRPARLFTLGLCLLFTLAACEHGDPLEDDNPPPSNVSLANDVQPIFTSSCALSGCHAGTFPTLGLDLTEGNAHASTVNVQSQEIPTLDRVVPGDENASYLYQKVIGASGISGERMPLGGAPLSAAQIETIRSWIAGGALNN